MKIPALFLTGYLLWSTASGVAQAQPQDAPAGNTPAVEAKPQTPEEKEKAQEKAMEAAMAEGQKQAMAMLMMTPEERANAVHKLMEQAFRTQLTGLGIKDTQTQDTLVNFIALQDQQRTEVRQAGVKLLKAVQGNLGDKDLDLLLSDYLGAVEDAKAEREQATKDLDDAIQFSKNPKLLALLNLLGIVGDASFYTGDTIMMGNMGIATLSGAFTATPAKQH